ncbi:hypothetical protein VTJ83DRAFT_3699 [Remersonia thermophila]|uniref:FHA domain-containing protein n=1 Tax=Remersonia thermophila TaxID=72144 RepID=A0ABR4DEQ3_9PEZI
MTAVANPPSFANINRPGWINGAQGLNSIAASDDARGLNLLMQRKTLQRTNSSSSISSNASSSSTSTVTSHASAQPSNGIAMPGAVDVNGWATPAARKRPAAKGSWPNGKADGAPDFSRAAGRQANGVNGTSQALLPHQLTQNGMSRQAAEAVAAGRQPVLYLLSLNGSFERKTITVPFYPDTLRIGRQTNAKTVPTPVNGYFDSKVLSRQHAEIWADANGKIWIRDVKSSNGTFVNGTRLSPENRESEPHELQAQDHLELGIDIVSEDQKTVVHHKVAAKVEHAGFLAPSNNVLDMGFGDLDPSNSMMPMGGVSPFRGRAGSQNGVNGRMGPGNMGGQPSMAPQRQYWLNPITTEHIVKKLHTEMRNARLQNQDLARTNQFIHALLSKEDIKNAEKPEALEPPKAHLPNGNISFRSDGGKTRFSDPPAPPPSQPLPEKPDAARASDAPSLKRGSTDRPKAAAAAGSSPVRQENNHHLHQILQLTEELNNAKKELDTHTARVRDLEEMLSKEREARLHAEDLIQKLEESSQPATNGAVETPLPNGHSELNKAFALPAEPAPAAEAQPPSGSSEAEPPPAQAQHDEAERIAAAFQARIEAMALEMSTLRKELESFRLRAERAEAERDADRKTLAELVEEIRRRDEREKQREAERRARSVSAARRRAAGQTKAAEAPAPAANGTAQGPSPAEKEELVGHQDADMSDLPPAPSRANTITPGGGSGGALAVQAAQQKDSALLHTLPYASMIGVVIFGMGLMAYLNGWQPQPKLDH